MNLFKKEYLKHNNILEVLLEKYSDKPWNWNFISVNPYVSQKIKHLYGTKLNNCIELFSKPFKW